MPGISAVSSTVTPPLMTNPLTSAQLEAINMKYGLDLSYHDASHYRAAQVIWNLDGAMGKPAPVTVPSQEAGPAVDTPAAIPAPEGIA